MSGYTQIVCDGCGSGYRWATGLGQPSHGSDRSVLKREGWHTVRKTGQPTRDICPECWKAGKR